MTPHTDSARTSVYFIADVHLVSHPDEAQRTRENDLIQFIRSIREDAETLYIVGDLFDFWFEYRSAVPHTGARVLFELYNLIQSGVKVVGLPGNHDIWIGRYLQDQVGIDLPGGPIAIEHQGMKIFLAHGDEFQADWKFRFSRAVLKNRLCIACFRLLHPDIGTWLARWTSDLSDYRARGHTDRNTRHLRELASQKIAEGFDALISGHYHMATHVALEGGSLLVLGDWISRNSFARLRCGELELFDWRTDSDRSKGQ